MARFEVELDVKDARFDERAEQALKRKLQQFREEFGGPITIKARVEGETELNRLKDAVQAAGLQMTKVKLASQGFTADIGLFKDTVVTATTATQQAKSSFSSLLGVGELLQAGLHRIGHAFRIAFTFTFAFNTIRLLEAGLSALFREITSGIEKLDRMRLQVIRVAGALQLLAQDPSRSTFAQFLSFAEGARDKLEVLGATALATGEELFQGFLRLTERGVVLTTTEQFKDLINVINAIVVATEGIGRPIQQISQELRAVLEGTARPGAQLVQMLVSLNPQFLEQIRSLRTIQERWNLIVTTLEPYKATQESVERTLTGQLRLLRTIADLIERLSAARALESIVSALERVNKSLFDQGELTQKAQNAIQSLGTFLSYLVTLADTIVNALSLVGDVLDLIFLSSKRLGGSFDDSVSGVAKLLDLLLRMAAAINVAVLGMRLLVNLSKLASVVGPQREVIISDIENQLERIRDLSDIIFNPELGKTVALSGALDDISDKLKETGDALTNFRLLGEDSFDKIASSASSSANKIEQSFSDSIDSTKRSFKELELDALDTAAKLIAASAKISQQQMQVQQPSISGVAIGPVFSVGVVPKEAVSTIREMEQVARQWSSLPIWDQMKHWATNTLPESITKGRAWTELTRKMSLEQSDFNERVREGAVTVANSGEAIVGYKAHLSLMGDELNKSINILTNMINEVDALTVAFEQNIGGIQAMITSAQINTAAIEAGMKILRNANISAKERIELAEREVSIQKQLLSAREKARADLEAQGVPEEEQAVIIESMTDALRRNLEESARAERQFRQMTQALSASSAGMSKAEAAARRFGEIVDRLKVSAQFETVAQMIQRARNELEDLTEAAERAGGKLSSAELAEGMKVFNASVVNRFTEAVKQQVVEASNFIRTQQLLIAEKSKAIDISNAELAAIDKNVAAMDLINKTRNEANQIIAKENELRAEGLGSVVDAAKANLAFADTLEQLILSGTSLAEVERNLTQIREESNNVLQRAQLKQEAVAEAIANRIPLEEEELNLLMKKLAINKLIAQQEIDPELAIKIKSQLEEALDIEKSTSETIAKFRDTMQVFTQLGERAAKELQSTFSDFFFDFFTGKLDSLADVFKSFWIAVVRMAAEAAAGIFLQFTGLAAGLKALFRSLGTSAAFGAVGVGAQSGSMMTLPGAGSIPLIFPQPNTTWLGVNPLLFLLPLLGAALGAFQGGVPGAIKGGFTGLGALGGAIGGTALAGSLAGTAFGGTAIGSAIGSILPGLGTLVGAFIGSVLGGALAKLFGSKPRLKIDIPGEDIREAILAGELSLTVEEFMRGLLTESGKEALIQIKSRKLNIDKERLRDELAKALLATLSQIEALLSTLPSGLFGKLDMMFRRAILNFEGVARDIEHLGIRFDKSSGIKKALEEFRGGEMQGALTFALRDFFQAVLVELQVQAEAASRFVSQAFEAFQTADSREARGQIAQQFLQDFQIIMQAAAFAIDEVGGSLDQMTNNAIILAHSIGFDTIPSIEELKDKVKDLLSADIIDPQLISNVLALRSAIIQLTATLAQSISELAGFISDLNSKIVELGGTAFDTTDALRAAINAIQSTIEQGGLSPDELKSLLGQMNQLVDQLVREELAAQAKVINAQISANNARIEALQDEADRVRKAARERLDALNEELRTAEQLRDLSKAIQKNIQDLMIGRQSIDNVFQRMQTAQALIADLFSQLATATDEEKIDIGRRAQELLNQSLEIAGEAFQQPSAEFRDQFRTVLKQLEELQKLVGPMRTVEEIMADIEAVNKEMDATLKRIDAQIEALRAKNEALQGQLNTLTGAAREEALAFYEFIREQAIKLLNSQLEQLANLGINSVRGLSVLENIQLEALTVLRSIDSRLGSLQGFQHGGVGDFGRGTLAVLHGKEAIVPLSNMNRVNVVVNVDKVDSPERAKQVADAVLDVITFNPKVRRAIKAI